MATVNSDIPDWARSCPTKKIKYQSAAEARRQLRASPYRTQIRSFYTYRCELCGFVHTSQQRPGAVKRERKKRRGQA
ncbi:hypothetical protein [[Kitasatospora] papulosa]|uniref:hypothetical protein n=1 Tax=[Kitasatospora] papulosa TaxID=1464011 RepID=UPI0036BDE072